MAILTLSAEPVRQPTLHCSSSASLSTLSATATSRVCSQHAADNEFIHQTASFLHLHLAIRNLIYHHVLVSKQNEPIDLSTRAYRTEPPLLLVCRQIRHEARAMYWFDNHFHFTVCQFNHLLLKSFYSHVHRIKAQEEAGCPAKLITGSAAANVTASLCNCQTCLRYPPIAPGMNLASWKHWLKSVHQAPHDFPCPAAATQIDLRYDACTVGRSRARHPAVSAFELIRSLNGLEWEQVEVVLKTHERSIWPMESAPAPQSGLAEYFIVGIIAAALFICASLIGYAIMQGLTKLFRA